MILGVAINAWDLVSYVVAATIIVFCIFLVESFISAKISEIKSKRRKLEHKYLEDTLDKIVDEIWDEIEKEKNEDGNKRK